MSTSASAKSPAALVSEYFSERPNAMTMVAARELELPESDVLRHMPSGTVREMASDRFEEIMHAFVDLGRVHVIASNGVVTLEAFGEFGNFSTWGDYFNVQTKSLDMHIRHKQIASVFAVEKPSHIDGVSTLSFQFYNSDGASAFKTFLTFGSKPPSDECRAKWAAIRDEFALKPAYTITHRIE